MRLKPISGVVRQLLIGRAYQHRNRGDDGSRTLFLRLRGRSPKMPVRIEKIYESFVQREKNPESSNQGALLLVAVLAPSATCLSPSVHTASRPTAHARPRPDTPPAVLSVVILAFDRSRLVIARFDDALSRTDTPRRVSESFHL